MKIILLDLEQLQMCDTLTPMKRFATVRGADNEKHLDAYIDGTDYEIIGRMDDVFIIAGEDVAGWTLDDYVIPRLASGLIFAEEIIRPVFERNQGVLLYEGSIILATVVDVRTVTFRTFDGSEPTINRIGVEFRLHLEYNDQLEKWQMRNIYAYRTDRPETSPRLPATDNQRTKLYKHFIEQAHSLPARVLLAGQSNGIELAIAAEEKDLERNEVKVAANKTKIKLMQIELEASLVS